MGKLVLIGGSKSNVGKTTLIRILLKLYPKTFVALKITNSLAHGVGISEETFENAIKGKDTYFFLENSKRVFWAKGNFDYLNSAIPKLIQEIEDPIIAEGNILYRIIKPYLFFFVENLNEPPKKEAEHLKEVADFLIANGNYNFKQENKLIFVNLKRNLDSIEVGFENFLTNALSSIIR